MSYELTLEKAGAEVLQSKYCGSYQGDWYAIVKYKGEIGVVEGSYGSCSGCDHFEGTFGYNDEPFEKDGKYFTTEYGGDEISKEEFDRLAVELEKKYVDFGEDYLRAGLYNKAHYEQRLLTLDKDDWFDEETKEGIDWCISELNKLGL